MDNDNNESLELLDEETHRKNTLAKRLIWVFIILDLVLASYAVYEVIAIIFR